MIGRRWAIALAVVIASGLGFAWHVGGALIAPVPRIVGDPPLALRGESVRFASASGSVIHAWMARGEPNAGAVLLLHGVRADRRVMLSRALFLHEQGYSVLAIDLQAHGESAGAHITFGYLESRDARAAVGFLRNELPGERIGVIGVSLGAAATVLANPPLGVDAVVLESMFPTARDAIADRLTLHTGALGVLGSPLLLAQIRPRLGVSADDLRPIDHIGSIGAPVFLIHGDRDRHTTLAEAQRIFAATAEPRQFWVVKGAAHVDLHRFAAQEYERRVSAWFERYLRPDVMSASRAARAIDTPHPAPRAE